MRHVLFPLAGIILMAAALTGCGQKGPLTLPAKPVEATTPAPVVAPVVAPATEPASSAPVTPDSKAEPTEEKADAESAASTLKDYKQANRHAA